MRRYHLGDAPLIQVAPTTQGAIIGGYLGFALGLTTGVLGTLLVLAWAYRGEP